MANSAAKPPLYPMLFKPFLRPMPWGGQKLRRWVQADFAPNEKIGEAWLLSDHPLHSSVVANGPLAGTTLRRLMAERSEELLGFKAERFPLLIKLLDASENLSIQVHPDDELAKTYAAKEGGKTEAWVVLEAEPNAAIYLGLKEGVGRDAVRHGLADGSLPDLLVKHSPKPGDCYFVPAGTVHALGGGTVVLEVQQTSDATFRLYDWGRVGPDGQPRKLHLEEGLACVKERPAGAGLATPQPLAPPPQAEVVARWVGCPYFTLDRYLGCLSNELQGPTLLVVIRGKPRLGHGSLSPGDCVLLPASQFPRILALDDPGDCVVAVHFRRK